MNTGSVRRKPKLCLCVVCSTSAPWLPSSSTYLSTRCHVEGSNQVLQSNMQGGGRVMIVALFAAKELEHL